MVGQDTRLPAFVGPGPLALRSGLHRVGPARRVGVAARRQLRVAGLGWSGSARLLHPGDAEQAQGEAQRDAHSHRPRRPQHGQQQRRPHGVPTAGPGPPRSPRRLRGGGTREGRIRRARAQQAGPFPPRQAEIVAQARNPRVGLQPLEQHCAPGPPRQLLSDVSPRGPRPQGGVSAVSYQKGKRGGG